MRKPLDIPTEPRRTAACLSISPIQEDHVSLQRIFECSGMESLWEIQTTSTVETASSILRANRIPIILAERDLSPGTWKDLLEEITTYSDPPLLIVTSRFADERLWAEALNLGVFDVLAKPFAIEEVTRTLALAWRHWLDRHGIHSMRTSQRASATAA